MKEMIIILLMLAAGLCFQAWLLLKPERLRIRKKPEDQATYRERNDG